MEIKETYEEAFVRYNNRHNNPELELTTDFFGRPAYCLKGARDGNYTNISNYFQPKPIWHYMWVPLVQIIVLWGGCYGLQLLARL